MEFKTFKAAAVIASPSLFNLDETVEKCCAFIDEAAENGAELVVFPETFVPMYPWWIWMGIDNVKKLELFKRLFKNSVNIEDAVFKKLRDKAKEKSVHLVIGINEKDGMTLYNSQVFVDGGGNVIGKRRKLVPTGEERTVWGRGYGEDLVVYDTELGKMGGLICYENTMPLSRYVLYDLGEQIHVANWPGSNYRSQPRDRTKMIDTVSRFIALEGQVFVVVSSSYVGQEELDFYLELDPSLEGRMDTGGGIAGIISPIGEYVSPPLQDQEGIAYGEIDFEMILDSKHLLDNVGHYARPDATRVLLNSSRQRRVEQEVYNKAEPMILPNSSDVRNEINDELKSD